MRILPVLLAAALVVGAANVVANEDLFERNKALLLEKVQAKHPGVTLHPTTLVAIENTAEYMTAIGFDLANPSVRSQHPASVGDVWIYGDGPAYSNGHDAGSTVGDLTPANQACAPPTFLSEEVCFSPETMAYEFCREIQVSFEFYGYVAAHGLVEHGSGSHQSWTVDPNYHEVFHSSGTSIGNQCIVANGEEFSFIMLDGYFNYEAA